MPTQRGQIDEPLVLEPSRLAHQELVPAARRERSIGLGSFTLLWLSMGAQMGVFTLGASLADALSVPQALLAIVIANVAIVVVLTLIGDIGIEHGLNFAGFLRAPFGLRGSYLPLMLRGLSAIAWFGIQTYFGATAIEVVTTQFFGVSAFPIWYVGFGILQIAIVAGGIGVIRRVIDIATPALILLSIWLLYLLFSRRSVWEFWAFPANEPQPFILGVVASLSYWATVAINLPDFTRYVQADVSARFLRRNRVSIVAQLLGLPTGMLLFSAVGMAAFVFTGEPNPVLAIASLMGGTALVLALVVLILAQLSTNITANLYAAAYVANALGSPKVSFGRGALITGILGLLTFPWVLLNFFLTFLPVVGAVLAPVAGVTIADYYLIRRRRLNVPELFNPKGQYWYWNGINPASLIAWAAGAAAGVLLLDYSFVVALPVALVLHFVLMRFWIVRQYGQTELQGKDKKDSEYLATTRDRDWPVRMATPD